LAGKKAHHDLQQRLARLVSEGLVVDLPRDGRSTVYRLSLTAIGFIEFTTMRVRDEIDRKRDAELMWTGFSNSVSTTPVIESDV
jgi:hypothetical protein